MDNIQNLTSTLSLSIGSAWASGINLYATIATLGILGLTGNLSLPSQLQVIQDPIVIGVASFMYIVEFIADKIPGFDTVWDVIHSFIRIPAGVILASGVIGDINPNFVISAGILGGTISATSHILKSGSRVLINTSPEPVSNWTASVVEDVSVIGGILTALHSPEIFLFLFVLFLLLSIWILPKLFSSIKILIAKIISLFSTKKV